MSKQSKGSYLKAVLSGQLVTLIKLGVGVFMTPFILQFLTRKEFGVYALLTEVMLFMALFDFGFTGALNVLVARNTSDTKEVSSLSSITATIQLVLSFFGLGVCCYIGFFDQELIGGDLHSVNNISLIIVLFGIGFGFSMVAKTYSTLLFAFRLAHLDNYIKLFGFFLRTGLIILFLMFDLGLLSLVSASVSVEIIVAILSIIRCRVYLKSIDVKYSARVNQNDFNQLFKLGIWFFLGTLSVLLIEKVDAIMTNSILGIEMVTLLVVSGRLFSIVKGLLYSAINNYRPYFGQLFEKNKYKEARNYFNRITRFSIVSCTVVGFTIVYVNESFLRVWVGDGFYTGDLIMYGFAFNLIYHSWKLPSRAYLSANLIVRPQSISGVFEGGLNLVISYLLGQKIGLTGVILGTAITGVIFYFPAYGWMLTKNKMIRFKDFVIENLILLIYVAVCWLSLKLFMEYLPISDLFSFQSVMRVFELVVVILIISVIFNYKYLSSIFALIKNKN